MVKLDEKQLQLGVPDIVDEMAEALYAKATKADDAAVPVALWDDAIWALEWHSPHQLKIFSHRSEAKQPLNIIRRLLERVAQFCEIYEGPSLFVP